MTLNMHDIVRGAIQAVNTDTPGTVYVSTGRTNVRGILTPTFQPVAAQLQIQAQPHDPIRHANNVEYSNSYITVYAYGDFSDIERPTGSGGDVVNFTDQGGGMNRWYYISQVMEWWPGWCSFECVRQLSATDIANLVAQLQNGANPA